MYNTLVKASILTFLIFHIESFVSNKNLVIFTFLGEAGENTCINPYLPLGTTEI